MDIQGHPKMGIGMINGNQVFPNLNLNPQLLQDFPGDAGLHCFSSLDFTSWKFPEATQQPLLPSPVDKNLASLIPDHGYTDMLVGQRFSRFTHG